MAWLVKTEPGEYSFDDLVKDKKTVWDGVRNPQALRNLRAMAPGERVYVYHTGDERQVVGRAEVARVVLPHSGEPVVELKALDRLAQPVPLEDLKSDATFKRSPLVRQGRLSVVFLTAAQAHVIDDRGRAGQ